MPVKLSPACGAPPENGGTALTTRVAYSVLYRSRHVRQAQAIRSEGRGLPVPMPVPEPTFRVE